MCEMHSSQWMRSITLVMHAMKDITAQVMNACNAISVVAVLLLLGRAALNAWSNQCKAQRVGASSDSVRHCVRGGYECVRKRRQLFVPFLLARSNRSAPCTLVCASTPTPPSATRNAAATGEGRSRRPAPAAQAGTHFGVWGTERSGTASECDSTPSDFRRRRARGGGGAQARPCQTWRGTSAWSPRRGPRGSSPSRQRRAAR